MAGVAAGNVAVVLAKATGANVTGTVDDATTGTDVVVAEVVVVAAAVVVVFSAPNAEAVKLNGTKHTMAPKMAREPSRMVNDFCKRVLTIPRH